MRHLLAALCVALLAALIPGTGHAQQGSGGLSPDQIEATRGNLMMAREMLKYGDEKKDAYSIIAAVRIFADAPGRILADGETALDGKDLDLVAQLDKAASYAAGD